MRLLTTFTDGRFLLAESQLNYVLGRYAPRAMVQALRTLPKNLDDLYRDIMDRIDASGTSVRDLAFKTLSWIFHAARPLHMDELRELLVILPGDSKLVSWTLPKDTQFVLKPCEGLVTYDDDGKVVRFAHYTVQNFLERNPEIRDSVPNLAEICLAYLAFEEFEEGPLREDVELHQRMEEHKAGSYVSQFWGFHTRGEAERSSSVRATVLSVLSSTRRRDAILQMEGYDQSGSVHNSYVQDQTPLHILARVGLSYICSRVLDGVWDEVERYLLCDASC